MLNKPSNNYDLSFALASQFYTYVLNVNALVLGTFNQENALVGGFSARWL